MTNPYVKGGVIGSMIIAAFSGAAYMFVTPENLAKIELPSFSKKKVPVPSQAGCNDQVVLRIVKDLRENFDDWEVDNYTVSRGTGWFDGPALKIWISNEDYGLDFNVDDNSYSNTGMKYPFTPQCRAYLYGVTSTIKARQKKQEIDKVTETFGG